MSVRGRIAIALSLGLAFAFAFACRSKTPPPREQIESAKPAKSAVPLEPEPEELPAVEGPAPGASELEREQTVIALLRGQRPSERFPVVATDDGGAVDPALRNVLSPRPEPAPLRGLGSL